MQGLKFGALVLGRKKMGNKRLHLALRPLRLNYTGHHRTAKNREFWVSTGGFCHLSGGGVCRGNTDRRCCYRYNPFVAGSGSNCICRHRNRRGNRLFWYSQMAQEDDQQSV